MRGTYFVGGLGLAMIAYSLAAAAGDANRRLDHGYRLLILDERAVRWRAPERGFPASVSYAFLTRPESFGGARNCGKMLPVSAALEPSNVDREKFRREVRAAFRMWQDAVNIEFREVRNAKGAGIVIGAQAEPRGRAFTNVATRSTPDGTVGEISQSLICLNPTTR